MSTVRTTDMGRISVTHSWDEARITVDLTMTAYQAHDLGRWLCEVARPPDTSYNDGLALIEEVHSAGYCNRSDCPKPLP